MSRGEKWIIRFLILAIILGVCLCMHQIYCNSIEQFLAQDTVNLEDGSISFDKSCVKNPDYFNKTYIENVNNGIFKIKLGDKVDKIIRSKGMGFVYRELEVDTSLVFPVISASLEYELDGMAFSILYSGQDNLIEKASIVKIVIRSAHFVTTEGITTGDTLEKVMVKYPSLIQIYDDMCEYTRIGLFYHKKSATEFFFINDKLKSICMYKDKPTHIYEK